MGKHSVTEAKNSLSRLIDRALEGEEVVITRRWQPVVQLKPVVAPVPLPPRPMSAADIEWLRAHRITPRKITEDAATLVRNMRDEEDH
jgi:prevent-host-death family protein